MAGLNRFQTRFPKSLTRTATGLFASDWANYPPIPPVSQVKIDSLWQMSVRIGGILVPRRPSGVSS